MTTSPLARIAAALRFLRTSTRGYRLRPWASPYLRWRIETYSGQPASTIDLRAFLQFTWRHRHRLFRFLRWTTDMDIDNQRRAAERSSARPAL